VTAQRAREWTRMPAESVGDARLAWFTGTLLHPGEHR
jgi:hypothetical protein